MEERDHVAPAGGAGAVIAQVLVERGLEGDRALARRQGAVVRDRLAVEGDPDHEQSSTLEGTGEELAGEAPVLFAACERTAALAFPSARFECEEFIDPARQLLARGERAVL